MSNTQSEAPTGLVTDPDTGKLSLPDAEPIRMSEGVHVEVRAVHGPDWFPLLVSAGLWQTTLYMRRPQLRALRDRLDEIDRLMPEPEPRVTGARS